MKLKTKVLCYPFPQLPRIKNFMILGICFCFIALQFFLDESAPPPPPTTYTLENDAKFMNKAGYVNQCKDRTLRRETKKKARNVD